MKASVIIPVYNGEKYISGLVEKLSNQTCDDFEAIFVNDGSKDKTLEILNSLTKDKERFKIISQDNSGICAARNAGIEEARGKYLIFIDQDDEVDFDLVNSYVSEIENSHVDISVFGTKRLYIVDDEVRQSVPQFFEKETVVDNRIKYEYLFNLDNKRRLSTVWNCIYKKEIVDNNLIRFDTHFRHGDEDGMFNMEFVTHCKSISFSDEVHYSYMLRQGQSTISKKNDNLLDDFIYYIEKMNKLIFKDKNECVNDLKNLYTLRFFSNVYMRLCRYSGTTKGEKIIFLKALHNNRSFMLATKYSTRRTKLKVSKKYYFWDVFNFFFIHERYLISVKLMDYLIKKKMKVAVIK